MTILTLVLIVSRGYKWILPQVLIRVVWRVMIPIIERWHLASWNEIGHLVTWHKVWYLIARNIVRYLVSRHEMCRSHIRRRYTARVCLIIRVVELHHLIVMHRIHILQILFICLSHIPVFGLMILSGSLSLFVPFPMIKGIFSMTSILNKIMIFVLFVNLWCLDWHLFLFIFVLLRRLLFGFKVFVILRLNWLYLVLIQNFCSLNVKNLLSDLALHIFQVLLRLDSIERTLNFTKYVDDKSNEFFVVIADPSIEINNLIRLF